LAAAVGLARHGVAVTLLEARPRLGGRASSFLDTASGQLVDACQHVSMGCCTNFAHFCQTIGVAHLLARQTCLHFVTPDGRRSRFAAAPWPAPLHLMRALLEAHYLSASDKLRIGAGLLALQRVPTDHDEPLADWLRRHGQTPTTIARFWGLVLVSALNEDVERLGLKYARKVFVDGFMRHRHGFEVYIPRVPLARLYGQELQTWLAQHGAQVALNHAVRQVECANGRVQGVRLRAGQVHPTERVIVAVPFERTAELVPDVMAARPLIGVPITSLHAWYDRAITSLPHAVLVDSPAHWLFNRGAVTPGAHYVQVVVSAARRLREQGHTATQTELLNEIGRFFPAARSAHLLRARVVTETMATFSAVPGVDASRPPQRTALPGLYWAGDWTATGWPATMEGAVRSGYLAAEAVLADLGRPTRLVQPDLA
jgi:squalene-associated FAD-dependent desaturase